MLFFTRASEDVSTSRLQGKNVSLIGSKLIDGLFLCASMDDIINSKKPSGRQRDEEELAQLELFKETLEKQTKNL